MLARITPSPLKGTVPAIASKSMAHRLIICAALANGETHVTCNTTCADIEATVRCLTALGARIETVEDGFHAPVHSSAQILLISGGRDPVAPPQWSALAAETLPNAKRVVIPWAGHTIDGLAAIDSCYDRMLLQFFDQGDARKVDAGCVSTMLPPPFATDR